MPYRGKVARGWNVPLRQCLRSIPIREGPGTPSFRPKVTWVISPVRLWEKAQFELTAALSTSARLVAIHQKSLR
jgi:hypothetical protein